MFVWQHGDLNEEQEAAVGEPGNVFLVACPGSGKTRALTYKIALELSKLGSSKKHVVAITYTNRAADEIHERIESLGVDTTNLWIGTIHAFCLEWILKPYGIYHERLKFGFKVIDPQESERIITELCRPYRNPRVTYWDCNAHFYTPAGLATSCRPAIQNFVNAIIGAYHARLLASRDLDFELILRYAYELVTDNPVISSVLGSLFSCVLVDEYQDTKEIQYSIIGSILRASNGGTTAFIVGDPNQAIYGSLGGYAITKAEFETVAGVTFVEKTLSQNHRSSERVVSYFENYSIHENPITAVSEHREYPSLISFDRATERDALENEIVRLLRYNIETLGVSPNEVCVLGPQWVHLASMTRRLVAALPEYSFDGPGMVPFARDQENFWYKLSKIALTEASPDIFVRRLRWAGDVLYALDTAGVDVSKHTRKSLLRDCNAVAVEEEDGLNYLRQFFDDLFASLEIDYELVPTLLEHHRAFFESSAARIERLRNDGAAFIGGIDAFRKVFALKKGITVSTIHGVKGAEFDTVIAFGLLEGMVPHFSDVNGRDSAKRLLYVIGSRARKNLHLISEHGRVNGIGQTYQPTVVLANCGFDYDQCQ